MSPWDTARGRYGCDLYFRTVVDALRGAILDLRLTPGDIREAAMLACILVEERSAPVAIECTCRLVWRDGAAPVSIAPSPSCPLHSKVST